MSGDVVVGPLLDLSGESSDATIELLASGDLLVSGSGGDDGTIPGISEVRFGSGFSSRSASSR